MSISSIKKYISNFKKYIRTGGVVYTNVSIVAPSLQLSNKIVFVSGGTSGIGLGIAKLFLAEGATVIISGRNKKKLDETKQALNNQNLYTICWDITDEKVADSKEFISLLLKLAELTFSSTIAGIYDSASWDKVTA